MKWSDEEIEIVTKVRPWLSIQEISDVLKLLGHDRSWHSVQSLSKSRGLPPFIRYGNPDCGDDKDLQDAVNEILKKRSVGELPDNLTVSSLNVGADGSIRQQWLRAKSADETREQALKRAISEIPSLISKPRRAKKFTLISADESILSVYPIGDPHIGMLAWAKETGEDYDLQISRRRHETAIAHLVERSDPTENALIINLGDFFHSDSNANVTLRSGNALDVDSRWQKTIETGVSIFVNMIEAALLRHKKVYVISAIGNHDDHSAIFLAIALRCFYRNEPRVEIDESAGKFHYFRFGSNLIGVTHGDTVKPQDMESIMACDRPGDWGSSTYRYWYIGHIHHSRKWEFRGCTVESFRTLAGKDAWHSGAGYRSRSDMTKILLHAEYGEVARYSIDVRLLAAMEVDDG